MKSLTLLASGLGLAALACTGEAPAPAPAPGAAAPTPVTLALNWHPEPEFGGFYEGVLGGHYADAGFDLTILPGGPGAPTLELLASGRAQVAITSADDLLVKRHKGVAAVAGWAAFQDSPLGVMVHADSPAARLSDLGALPGARVAIEVGSPFQRFLWSRLGWEGKVEAVPAGGSVGPFLADPALAQQGYVTSEPCVARARGAEVRFLPAAEVGWNPYGTVVAFADPPPAWAADFVAATQAAWAAYLADPARANAEISRLNEDMGAEMVACVTEAQRPFVTGEAGLGAWQAARWQQTADTLVAVGLLPAGARAEGAWVELRAP